MKMERDDVQPTTIKIVRRVELKISRMLTMTKLLTITMVAKITLTESLKTRRTKILLHNKIVWLPLKAHMWILVTAILIVIRLRLE